MKSAPRTPYGALPGFTLVEMMMALALGAVVMGAALAGILSLQKSYASTEQYAADLADQTRLLDSLSMDLRRATAVTVTADTQGNTTALTISLPDYYRYDATTGRATPNTPSIYLNPEPRLAFYGNRITPPQEFYRLDKASTSRAGPVTREEVRAGAAETRRPPACLPVADRVVRFSVIFDAADGSDTDYPGAIQARLTAIFQPIFQTPAVPDPNSASAPVITLHGMVFLRNNDTR